MKELVKTITEGFSFQHHCNFVCFLCYEKPKASHVERQPMAIAWPPRSHRVVS